MSALSRRLDRLESTPTGSGGLLMVPAYHGMSEAEALTLVFGDAPPPAGAQVIFVRNALPPRSVPYHWWTELDQDSEAFAAAYATCRGSARQVNAGLPQQTEN